MNVADDFYEEDEPIEHIKAILRRPPDGITWPPPNNFVWTPEQGLQRIQPSETCGWSYVRPVAPPH